MVVVPHQRVYWVYIMTNKSNSVYYIGMTNNIRRRVIEHRSRIPPESFTSRYNVFKLIYTETYRSPIAAIRREKKLKRWKRAWKQALIEEENPAYEDLLPDLYP